MGAVVSARTLPWSLGAQSGIQFNGSGAQSRRTPAATDAAEDKIESSIEAGEDAQRCATPANEARRQNSCEGSRTRSSGGTTERILVRQGKEF